MKEVVRLEIVLKKISELIPYINNTRTHDEKQIKQIASSIKELVDLNKTNELIKEIKKSKLSEEEKEFLIYGAYRHNVFNYELIADFYAHSNEEMQNFLEKSAMIIIDFDKAIENGYIKLSKETLEEYGAEYETD